jgi:hypothetical protein
MINPRLPFSRQRSFAAPHGRESLSDAEGSP